MTLHVTAEDVMSVLQLLTERLGHSFRQPSSLRLQKFLEMRAESLGDPTVESYVNRCGRDAMEFQQLVNVLTNGLTAFFRDTPQLDAVRAAFEEGNVSTVWCAGCSTGEEAYTLSAIAQEVGAEIDILATDINTDFLARAQEAVYDEWSLRLMEHGRGKIFDRADNGLWSVKPEVRRRVRFQHHNLMTPPPVQHADIVICRNVLIYFSEPGIDRCLATVQRVIGSNGLLILGSSEQLLGDHTFVVNERAGGFVYQVRAGVLGSPTGVSSVATDDDISEIMSQGALTAIAESGIENLASNEFDNAIACFEAAVAYDPFWADAHALTGFCLEQIQAPRRAADAYTKALFLDPGHWWSAYRSARIWCDIGENATARRHAVSAKNLIEDGQEADPILDPIIELDIDQILRELGQILN